VYSSAFCRVYNEFGWNVYPEVFAGQLLELLDRRGARVRSALDLGCGTGILCRELSGHGIAAAGVDLSEGMIGLARRQAPLCRFETADMVTYRPAERFDLVTATGDVLNHVFDEADLQRIFRNVSGYLNRGGLFVFDLLRESEIPPDEPFELEYSQTVRAVFRTSRLPGDRVRLRIQVFENGVSALTEDILEKLHDPGAVCAMLEEAGLAVERCSDALLPDSGLHSSTWYVVARKKENMTKEGTNP
jgi:SAM-dependent methyltransferase